MNALLSTLASVSKGRRRFVLVALIASGVSSSVVAIPPTDGDLDSTFGTTGSGYTIVDFGNGSNGHQDGAHRLLRQPDGKFVAVGSVDNGYGFQAIGLARINNNGQIDTSFGDIATPGRSITTGASSVDYTGSGIALLPSGRLIVAGTIGISSSHGTLIAFPADGGTSVWNVQGVVGSAYNDVLALPDGRLLVGGATPGSLFPSSNDFSLVLHDNVGNVVDQITVGFDLGGSDNDSVQRIAFVPAVAADRLGYVYAIGSVALPDYASGHHNIECGVVKAGLYSAAPRLRLEPSFGTANSGKLVLDINSGWAAGRSDSIDGNAYCRGLAVRKDGGLLITGERYYFGTDNQQPTADSSVGFAAKIDANGLPDAAFHNASFNGGNSTFGGGFSFYWQSTISGGGGLYEGFWFSLTQYNGQPLFGGLAELVCDSSNPGHQANRSWVLRTSASGAVDTTYTQYFCDLPRSSTDTGFDVALDGVFDNGGVVTVGNVFSSSSPGSATDFIFMRRYGDLIFTDNFDPGY